MRMTTASAAVAVAGAEHGQQIVVDPHPLVGAGVSPDQDGGAGGEEDRPAERPQVARGGARRRRSGWPPARG